MTRGKGIHDKWKIRAFEIIKARDSDRLSWYQIADRFDMDPRDARATYKRWKGRNEEVKDNMRQL